MAPAARDSRSRRSSARRAISGCVARPQWPAHEACPTRYAGDSWSSRRRPSEPHLRPPRQAWARCRDRALQSSTAFYGVSWNSPQVPVSSRLVFTEAYGHVLTSTHMFGTFPGHRKGTTDLSRLRLPVQKKPYTGPTLARGIGLLYRRNAGAGSCVVKATDGHGATWTKAFAFADDFEDADGGHVLSYFQASDIARRLARGRDDTPDSKPVTVAAALNAYEADLRNRGAHLANVTRVQFHMTAAFGAKPVGLLTARDLQALTSFGSSSARSIVLRNRVRWSDV